MRALSARLLKVKFILLVPFLSAQLSFSGSVLAQQAAPPAQCQALLSTLDTPEIIAEVFLGREQARLFELGPKGALKLILEGDFTAGEKVKLWRESVRLSQQTQIFISDEVHFEFAGEPVVAFVGLASQSFRSLLFIMDDGSALLTHTPKNVADRIYEEGGGLKAALKGSSGVPHRASVDLKDYLAGALAFALAQER